MKKKLSILLATLMVGATFVGCGAKEEANTASGDITTSQIVKNITDKVETAAMGPIEGELLTEQFHLNMDDVEEQTIENGMMNTGLEVIAVVKAKEGKVDSVKASLEKVIEDKKASAFYPGEPEAVEAAQLKVNGNYVGLFLIPEYEEGEKNVERAVEIFEESLK